MNEPLDLPALKKLVQSVDTGDILNLCEFAKSARTALSKLIEEVEIQRGLILDMHTVEKENTTLKADLAVMKEVTCYCENVEKENALLKKEMERLKLEEYGYKGLLKVNFVLRNELEIVRKHNQRMIEGLKETEKLHPDYGPCDGFRNGACSECFRIVDALKAEVSSLRSETVKLKNVNTALESHVAGHTISQRLSALETENQALRLLLKDAAVVGNSCESDSCDNMAIRIDTVLREK